MTKPQPTALISVMTAPETPIIDGALLSSLAAPSEGVHWHAPGIACEWPVFENPDLNALRTAAGGAPVDINVIKLHDGERRPVKLVLCDMDSTLIAQECIDEMAELAGKRAEISRVTEEAMNGLIDFETALKNRVAALAGLDLGAVQRLYDTRISLNPGAQKAMKSFANANVKTALVSGGFTIIAERVAEDLAMNHCFANRLEAVDGKMTGRVIAPILGPDAKVETLRALCSQYGLSPGDIMAVGDGANDLGMIKEAGLGVAFRAKPRVAAAATCRLDHADLSALAWLAGFSTV